MSKPVCAICGGEVPMHGDHVEVNAREPETPRQHTTATYFFHPECWGSVADGWNISGD